MFKKLNKNQGSQLVRRELTWEEMPLVSGGKFGGADGGDGGAHAEGGGGEGGGGGGGGEG